MTKMGVPLKSGRLSRAALSVGAALSIAGCASLPSSGPTGRAIQRAASERETPFPYALIEVRSRADIPGKAVRTASTIAEVAEQPTDLIGPGDLLNITIYEAGVALFGNSGLRTGAGGTVSFDPSSTAERLPAVRVNDQGIIRIPFVGPINVAGRTVLELQAMIRDALRGMSQDPQVVVSLQESITNSVILAGEVTKPGRLVLVTNRESLIDAIALAGGYRGAAKDIVARVQRDGGTFEIRLSDLLERPSDDVRVAPGDRITLVGQPQTFSVLGAPGRAEDIVFSRANLNLAEAVAEAGGANPNQGDAGAIFVFRYIKRADGTEQPSVFHLNMMEPGAYLLSQKFLMQDRDVLYVGNARANQLTKFVQLLSQLFLPVTTVGATVTNVR